MDDAKQSLLSPRLDGEDSRHQERLLSKPSFSSATFNPDTDDILPINGVRDFFREYMVESKKLWFLAGPAIFTTICQLSLGAITQVFSGQVGTLALAAVSVESSVIVGFSFGVMVNL
ncbi:protein DETOXIFICATION 31-like [Hibiscus syriacus]|uniref:protein DETOXIFICATION 31-like n=1 Tax=Hibiscus syriacus TaxID=106335 RepID=UPI001924C94A|nr:protein DETOXIFICATION 31-like [Hibiscus syriacus]